MNLPASTFSHSPEQPRQPEEAHGRKELPINETEENYDNAGACHECTSQSSGPQPDWLKYDRQVLRFFGYFKEQVDERVEENYRIRKCAIYYYLADGMIHIGVLNYFLGDDTVEILEITGHSNGHMPFPKLLRRQKLPKQTPSDLLGSKNMATAKPKDAYYCDKDFQVGSYIKVFNRDMLIHDTDEFTRNYYRTKYGVSDDMLEAVNVQEEGPVLARMPVPPHNGYGSEADSYMNCISLIPKAAPKDHYKFIYKDGKVLSSSCKLVEDATHKVSDFDKTRAMVFQYFLGDDTVSVFEPPAQNSGCASGRYLQRVKVPRKPGTKRPYSPSDCYMGARLELHQRLIQADEWTLKYMEADPNQFPMSCYHSVSKKLKELIAKLPDEAKGGLVDSTCDMGEPSKSLTTSCTKEPECTKSLASWQKSQLGSLPKPPPSIPEQLEELLDKAGINLIKQEIVTLDRFAARNQDKYPDVYSLVKSHF